MTSGHDFTLNYEPVEDLTLNCDPRVMFLYCIVTAGLDSKLNCDPIGNCDLRLGSQFNVKFLSGVIIQRGVLTRGHNSTWNSDPSTYLLPVGLRLKMVSKFNSVIEIQQLRRVIIQRKVQRRILTPGRYSIGGQCFILHRHSPKSNIT